MQPFPFYIPPHWPNPSPVPSYKSPFDTMEYIDREGTRRGKSDRRKRFMVSCTLATESEGGWLYVLPGELVKEIYDNIGGHAGGPLDSFGDLFYNAAGWTRAAAHSCFGYSCEDYADGMGVR